jgi:hypothetical protein
MPRRLLAINVVLACVAILCVALIVKQLATSRPPATARGRAPVGSSANPVSAGDSKLPPQAYNVIASRNLFSPTRSETAGPGTAGGVAQAPGVPGQLQPGQQPFPGQPQTGGQLPNQGLVPVPGPTQPLPSPRTFNPGNPLPPGQTMPPPPAIQQPTQTQPGAIPFGRPAPSLGRRMPPIPPGQQPAPSQ